MSVAHSRLPLRCRPILRNLINRFCSAGTSCCRFADLVIADRNKIAQTAIAAALTDAAERVENVTKVLDQMLVSGVTRG
jgi:hypothetical protein